MKVNYLFYFCNDIGSVFDSQVFALVKAINETKIFKKIFLFIGIRKENQKTEFLSRNVADDIKIIFYKSYSNYPFFNYLNRKSISDALINENVKFEEVLFHTRGEMTAWYLSRILSKKFHNKIIPDIRGVSVEETIEYYNYNKIIKLLKTYNSKRAIKNLNKLYRVSVVSNALKNYLIKNYCIKEEKIWITPCLAGNSFRFSKMERESKRKEFGLNEDDLLIVFSSGGTAKWQNNDAIAVLAEKNIKILNLSKTEIKLRNVINKFIDYSEMPSYLNAADIAIIWRDESIVNKVASPVKFSEYICCGLPVIANDSVDMIKEYILKNTCGILLDNLKNIDINSLKELKQINRQVISNSGLSYFGIESVIKRYDKMYSELKYL